MYSKIIIYLQSTEDIPDILQKVDLQVFSDDDCEQLHNNDTDRRYNVCAGVPEGGKGQCNVCIYFNVYLSILVLFICICIYKYIY